MNTPTPTPTSTPTPDLTYQEAAERAAMVARVAMASNP